MGPAKRRTLGQAPVASHIPWCVSLSTCTCVGSAAWVVLVGNRWHKEFLE